MCPGGQFKIPKQESPKSEEFNFPTNTVAILTASTILYYNTQLGIEKNRTQVRVFCEWLQKEAPDLYKTLFRDANPKELKITLAQMDRLFSNGFVAEKTLEYSQLRGNKTFLEAYLSLHRSLSFVRFEVMSRIAIGGYATQGGFNRALLDVLGKEKAEAFSKRLIEYSTNVPAALKGATPKKIFESILGEIGVESSKLGEALTEIIEKTGQKRFGLVLQIFRLSQLKRDIAGQSFFALKSTKGGTRLAFRRRILTALWHDYVTKLPSMASSVYQALSTKLKNIDWGLWKERYGKAKGPAKKALIFVLVGSGVYLAGNWLYTDTKLKEAERKKLESDVKLQEQTQRTVNGAEKEIERESTKPTQRIPVKTKPTLQSKIEKSKFKDTHSSVHLWLVANVQGTVNVAQLNKLYDSILNFLKDSDSPRTADLKSMLNYFKSNNGKKKLPSLPTGALKFSLTNPSGGLTEPAKILLEEINSFGSYWK